MAKIVALFVLFISSASLATEPIKIEFEKKNDNFRLYLINSYGDVLINKRLSIGPTEPPGVSASEIELEIRDSNGERYPFNPLIHMTIITENDIVLFRLGQIIGRKIERLYLIRFYTLGLGTYRARAIYQNKDKTWADKGVYNGRLISDWITFEVTESDMLNIYGENWREEMNDYLRRKKEFKEQHGINEWW